MKPSIDVKSALVGGLLVALILCLAGAVPFAERDEFGRFQIETNDSHAFILDSATGQVWSSIFIGNHFGQDPGFHGIKTNHTPGGY